MEAYKGVPEKIGQMMESSWLARDKAYCPYSQFRVGSAVLTKDGTIFDGCNVENASYGLCVCAERVAITKAVSEGHRKFTAIAICSDNKRSFKASCGACRQFIAEFGLNLDMYLLRPDRNWKKVSFAGLLPMAFTPESLQEDRIVVT